jgi:hypothetical protein
MASTNWSMLNGLSTTVTPMVTRCSSNALTSCTAPVHEDDRDVHGGGVHAQHLQQRPGRVLIGPHVIEDDQIGLERLDLDHIAVDVGLDGDLITRLLQKIAEEGQDCRVIVDGQDLLTVSVQ